MSDTLFLHQTSPLTTSETRGYALDTTVLPSGDLAELYDTGAGTLVVALTAPGASGPRLQNTLPVPDGHDLFEYTARFAEAPGDGVAVVFESNISGTGMRFLNAVRISPDGSTLSEDVNLASSNAWDTYWNTDDITLFDGGGFAFVETTETYDDVAGYTQTVRVVRTGPDGTLFGDGLTISDGASWYWDPKFQALPGGRLAVLAFIEDEDGLRLDLQIMAADGTPAGPAQTIAIPEFDVFDANPELLPLEDGGVRVVWMESAAGLWSIRSSLLDADGILQPPVTLSSLGDTTGGYSYLHDATTFADGSFGILVQDLYGSTDQVIYQHLDRDGSPLSDPAVLYEGTLYYSDAQISLLPAGGAVIMRTTYPAEGGSTLNVRYFGPDGTALGPETAIATTPPDGGYYYDPQVLVLPDGGTLFRWISETYDAETGWTFSQSQVGFSPIPFRPLTDGDDTETLTTPEAVDGLAGDDAITGSDGTDRILGSAGDDTLDGGDGDDFLHGGSGANVLIGGAGMDAAYFTGDFDSFRFTFNADGSEITVLGTDSSDRLSGVERFVFADQSLASEQILVRGGFFDEVLDGTDAADTLDGGLGDDTLRGGAGDDLLDGGDGRDQINGGDGNDTIIGGAGSGDRRDRIFGGAGEDEIDAGDGNDLVYGQAGDDTIIGGFGSDELFGQTGDDVITGSAYSDLIFGGDGNDFLNGGFGHDRINGGAGADKFYHAGDRGHGSDWIQDYVAEDGDVLVFGDTEATFDEFRVTFAHAENRYGERPGDDDMAEAFIAHVPSGFVVWALVDGAAQDHLWLKIPGSGEPADLLSLL